MKEVTDFKELSSKIMKYFKRGVITNNFLSPESMKCEIKEKNLFYEQDDNFLNIFVKRDGFYRLYFYALNDKVLFKNTMPKTVCDFAGDDHGVLINNGFLPYISRVRLTCDCADFEKMAPEAAEIADSEQIYNLAQAAFDKYSGYTPTRTEISEEILKGKIYIKKIGSETAGFLRYGISGKTAEIKHLCVSEKFRRKGIAGELVSMFLSESTKSVVWTGTENAAALALYKEMGFFEDGCKSTVYMKG